MSNDSHAPLLDLTNRLLDQYRQLDQLVNQMIAKDDHSTDGIGQHLVIIKQIEDELSPLREDFRSTNETVPAWLSEPTDQTIELVQGLMPKLAQLEKSTLEAADRLFPKIQESVRVVQMQKAYGASTRS